METHFAPAERAEQQHVLRQAMSVDGSTIIHALLQNDSDLLLVVNAHRQIVAFNKSVTSRLGMAEPEKVLGLRLGEVLHCRYAFNAPNGCGTTPFCASCGAVIAMMAAIDDNRPCERKCALTTYKKGHARDYCLLIRSQPVVVDGNRWVLIYAQDITEQQHWANLESEFLQDLDNKLCFIKNYSEYVYDQIPTQAVIGKLTMTIGRVVREVKLQSTLKNHQQAAFLALVEVVNLRTIRNLVFNTVLNRSAMTGKEVVEVGSEQQVTIATDPVLTSRVIINMVLNALEATPVGGSVELKTVITSSTVTWNVWNQEYIPEQIQLRIFQKYFSTKSGHGHGLGTYRMKLLGEKYLGGTVDFLSEPGAGTTFSFALPRT